MYTQSLLDDYAAFLRQYPDPRALRRAWETQPPEVVIPPAIQDIRWGDSTIGAEMRTPGCFPRGAGSILAAVRDAIAVESGRAQYEITTPETEDDLV
jgi:hypothetical protein